ncbi:MAG: PAS domain-containing protein, partial [Desulfosudaceae bacterium]
MDRESVKTGWADRIRQLTQDENELRYLRKIIGQCLHTPRKTNALLETVVSFTGSPIACLDTDFTYIFVNQAYARACGKAIDTFYGLSHFALCPDEDCRGCFEEVLQTGRPVFLEAWPVKISSRLSDPPCYWNQGVLPIQDGNGEVEHILLSCEDVTRQFNAEKAAARFRAAADHAGYGLAIVDFSGNLTYANQSFARFLDCRPEELLRYSLHNWVADTDQPDLTKVLKQTCREGEACQREWRLCRRDGRVFPAYMALAPVNLADKGQPDFVVVTLLDISDIKQFQNQLLEAEKMAVFGRLATNVVHEASSPLQTAMI